jgi:hypothetical protein
VRPKALATPSRPRRPAEAQACEHGAEGRARPRRRGAQGLREGRGHGQRQGGQERAHGVGQDGGPDLKLHEADGVRQTQHDRGEGRDLHELHEGRGKAQAGFAAQGIVGTAARDVGAHAAQRRDARAEGNGGHGHEQGDGFGGAPRDGEAPGQEGDGHDSGQGQDGGRPQEGHDEDLQHGPDFLRGADAAARAVVRHLRPPGSWS